MLVHAKEGLTWTDVWRRLDLIDAATGHEDVFTGCFLDSQFYEGVEDVEEDGPYFLALKLPTNRFFDPFHVDTC